MTVRASLDNGSFDGDDETMVQVHTGSPTNPKGMQLQLQQAPMQMPTSEPVKVLLGLVDTSMLQVFQNAFGQMPATVELVAAAGADNILNVSSLRLSSARPARPCLLISLASPASAAQPVTACVPGCGPRPAACMRTGPCCMPS